jgi:hypothetical protein
MSTHQIHYLVVAIGIVTIVAMVAGARNQEDASLALRSPRLARKASIWDPLKNRIFRNFLGRKSLVSERSVRHGSNLVDEYRFTSRKTVSRAISS